MLRWASKVIHLCFVNGLDQLVSFWAFESFYYQLRLLLLFLLSWEPYCAFGGTLLGAVEEDDPWIRKDVITVEGPWQRSWWALAGLLLKGRNVDFAIILKSASVWRLDDDLVNAPSFFEIQVLIWRLTRDGSTRRRLVEPVQCGRLNAQIFGNLCVGNFFLLLCMFCNIAIERLGRIGNMVLHYQLWLLNQL